MTENNGNLSMEDILSSIKRIIAEDKTMEFDRLSHSATPKNEELHEPETMLYAHPNSGELGVPLPSNEGADKGAAEGRDDDHNNILELTHKVRAYTENAYAARASNMKGNAPLSKKSKKKSSEQVDKLLGKKAAKKAAIENAAQSKSQDNSANNMGPNDDPLVDEQKVEAMRQSLSALATMGSLKSGDDNIENSNLSIEEMTRSLLRPMLKEWLDTNLQPLVEKMVAREIQRISQK